MKQFTLHAICVTAIAVSAATLSAAPALVSPRVAPSSPAAAAKSAVQSAGSYRFHPPKPPKPPKFNLVTSTVDGAPGSLRSVLAGAADGDTIKFALKLPAIVSLTNMLVITQSVTIAGPGCDKLTVMRSAATNTPMFRVFQIESGDVVLSGISVQNGVAFDANGFVDNVGGGIFNRGNLTVSNCCITGNSAPTTPTNSIGFGGGIFSDGKSSLTLINTTVSGNSASAAGGGVSTIDAAFVAKGCTFSGNFAGIQGGGVNFQGAEGLMQNCTISGNSTPLAGVGSGLLTVAFAAQAAPSLTVVACTIAGNTGGTSGAFSLVALNQDFGLTNTVLSTLVADNDEPEFYFYGPTTFISLGHNLDADGTSGMVNGTNGDIVGSSGSPINPLLGPLQDNGGPTETMALLVGSPALGAGSCVDATGAPLLVDQRGFPRASATGCDIGAYENTPLTLLCPGPVVVDFQNQAGAIVYYKVKTVDFCPNVDVSATPPPGSLFPIGDTLVSVQATDGCSGNSSACAFTVTVLGPQGVKSNVLSQLVGLYAHANPWDKQKLQAAIGDVSASLGIGDTNVLWVDATHLDAQNGGTVFLNEQQAVAELSQIGHSKWGYFHDDATKPLIVRLVKCDRLLATVAIADAIQGGGNPVKISAAKKEAALGDIDAALGKPAKAIQHYWNAWTLVVGL
jgi:hypothetical protein